MKNFLQEKIWRLALLFLFLFCGSMTFLPQASLAKTSLPSLLVRPVVISLPGDTAGIWRCDVDDPWVQPAPWPRRIIKPAQLPSIEDVGWSTLEDLVYNSFKTCGMEIFGKHFEPMWNFVEKKRLPSTISDFFELWTSFAEIPKDPEALKVWDEIFKTALNNNEIPEGVGWSKSEDVWMAVVKCASQSIVKSLPLPPSTREGLSNFIEAMDQINGLYDIRRTLQSDLKNPQKVLFGGAQIAKIPDRIRKLSEIYQKWDWYQTIFIEERAGDMDAIVGDTVVEACDPETAITRKDTFVNEALKYLRELREEAAYCENAYLYFVYKKLGPGWSPDRAPNKEELLKAQRRLHNDIFFNWVGLHLASNIYLLEKRQCRLATVISNFRTQWEEKWEPLVEKKMAQRKEAFENFKKYTAEYRDAIWDCKSESEIEAAYEKMDAVAKSPCGHGFDDPADMRTWGEFFGDVKTFIGLPSVNYTPDRKANWRDILEADWTDEEKAVLERLRNLPTECSEEALAKANSDLKSLIGYTETANLRCEALKALEHEKLEEKVEKFEEDVERVLAFLRDNWPPNAVAVMKEKCDPGLALEVF
ncbi:MAG: hypothetical protein JRJ20_14480, partial [Deltaproteobacteria bacterium]|nr:hypothetical protein [Deltaproteobacteria bacterium]